MNIAVFCGSSSPKKQTYIETMKKIMLLCAVLFTLAASAEAQGDTFYVHSVYHNGVVLYEEDWRENAEEWPAKYVVEDSSTFRFAQFEYKKIRLKGEPQEWIISHGCDDVGYDYVYEVEYNGKKSELEISKYRNEDRNCCRSYGVDGYKFLVCPYPPDEKMTRSFLVAWKHYTNILKKILNILTVPDARMGGCMCSSLLKEMDLSQMPMC